MTTPTRHIAKSIRQAIHGPEMDAVCNLATDPKELIRHAQAVVGRWQHNLYERRPAPALAEDGVLVQPTDLDLSTFLAALAQRQAVIKIPTYRSRREATAKADPTIQRMLDVRYGQIAGLVSNQKCWSFSARLLDLSLLKDGKPGVYRTFMVVDVDGEWHAGFRKFEFAPDRAENDFINRFALQHEGQIDFSSFVHPLRWQSFYGANYLLAKAMVSALAAAAKHYRAAAKAAAVEAGAASSAEGGDGAPAEDAETVDFAASEDERAAYEDLEVYGIEAAVGYTTEGAYPTLTREAALAVVAATRKPLEELRYATRATEFAFWQAGETREKLQPSWLQNVTWEDDVQKRTKWRRLRLEQRAVGERAVDLRYRPVTQKTRVRVYGK